MFSRDIAEVVGVSTQHASTLLKQLHKKGYVTRENVGEATGGREYEYRINKA